MSPPKYKTLRIYGPVIVGVAIWIIGGLLLFHDFQTKTAWGQLSLTGQIIAVLGMIAPAVGLIVTIWESESLVMVESQQ